MSNDSLRTIMIASLFLFLAGIAYMDMKIRQANMNELTRLAARSWWKKFRGKS